MMGQEKAFKCHPMSYHEYNNYSLIIVIVCLQSNLVGNSWTCCREGCNHKSVHWLTYAACTNSMCFVRYTKSQNV